MKKRIIKPMDRQRKQPTNKVKENNEFEKLLNEKLQESYFNGIKRGSHMQCSTILDLYKAKLDEIPQTEVTNATLEEILNDIFKFCELGCTTELDLRQFAGESSEV